MVNHSQSFTTDEQRSAIEPALKNKIMINKKIFGGCYYA